MSEASDAADDARYRAQTRRALREDLWLEIATSITRGVDDAIRFISEEGRIDAAAVQALREGISGIPEVGYISIASLRARAAEIRSAR